MTYVPTRDIRAAVAGREGEVLAALGINRSAGNTHICCPFPNHNDANPSWRWDAGKARAFCTCDQPASIFDIVMKMRVLDFDGTKIEVARLIGRADLIREPRAGKMTAAACSTRRPTRPPPSCRADTSAIASASSPTRW
jgi:hypothetical protein